MTKRSHLPATLGSAYEAIESAINEDMELRDHDKYIKEMLKTKPDALKMIEGLERLDKGDPDAEEMPQQPALNGTGPTAGGYTYSTTIPTTSSISAQPLYSPHKSNSGALVAEGDMEVTGSLTVSGKDFHESMAERIRAATEEIKDDLAKQLKDKGETENE